MFPSAVRRVCWFHVKKAVEERAGREPAEARVMLLADIADLQLLDDDMLRHLSGLMLEKWSDRAPGSAEFVNYFKNTVLGENSAFREGVHLAPKTDCRR